MKNFTLLLLALCTGIQSCKKNDISKVAGVNVIVWNEANHNAFTDLIKYNNNYYCVFRIASSHDSFDGRLRILQSYDSKTWNAFTLINLNNMDLRDPHFFVDNNNVLCVGSSARDKRNMHVNVIFKLKDNEFIRVNTGEIDNDYWLWSFTKSNDNLYAIGYNLHQPCFNHFGSTKPKLSLFNSTTADCISYKKISDSNWLNKSFKCPCEASMLFIKDSIVVVIVRDEDTPGESHIGVSTKPYQSWHWQTFPFFVRGPKLALLPDGRIFLAAGSIANYNKTCFAILNPDDFSVEKINVFPSGGDTGYPGVIIEGNTALVSYYSSHEGNARIYIERITY